jgi:small subunit ribosomal protein S2
MEEIARLEKKVGGIKNMEELPGAIVIADVKEAELVLNEARKMRVPIVGIVDTNTDPAFVDYPIPGNDDALSSFRIFGQGDSFRQRSGQRKGSCSERGLKRCFSAGEFYAKN